MRPRTLVIMWLCFMFFACGGKNSSSAPSGASSNPDTPNPPVTGQPTSNPFANSENQRFSGGSSGFYQSGQFRVYGNVTSQSAGPISSERFLIRSQNLNIGAIGIQLQTGVGE